MQGWKSPIKEFNQHQRTIDAIVQGWKSPIKEFNQQQIELQKILSSIESKSKTQSFDFSESLLVVNNVLEDTRIDIETNVTSNPTEFEQELLTWTHEQIEIFRAKQFFKKHV
ncbi:hypothetical protein CW734_08330 [Planococcus sp. MB-3u-03]|nr:hypothetical protein CW734_08330 [Planococcus sp. MB-3u-03]